MTGLTDELVTRIRDAVAAGATYGAAGSSVGVPRSTFRNWRRTGREDVKAERDTVHARLIAELERAEGEAQVRAVQAAFPLEGNLAPRDALAFMARRWPAEWSERVNHHVSVGFSMLYDAVDAEFPNEPEIRARFYARIDGARSGLLENPDVAAGATDGIGALGSPEVIDAVIDDEAG